MSTIEVQICFHCGEDCLDEKVIFEEKSFCCNGCSQVYQILNGAGLNDYYKIQNAPGISQKNRSNGKYDYLEREEIINKLLEFNEGDTAKIKLSLPQIHCSSCIWLLERLHTFQKGVVSSRVNFLKKEAYITFNKSQVTLRTIVQLLASVGYDPNITLQSGQQKQNKQNNTQFYAKLGVAGFCFGNIMLLSFPEYLSLDDIEDSFKHLFGYLNFTLSLPVLLYSASDYFRSAYGSLKQKFFNIDVPISLGILALFIRSTYDIFLGSGAGFMDSLAGFVFFLLIGKWFQNKTYDTLSFERDYKSYFPLSVTLKNGDNQEAVLVENLKKGDIIEIRNQELIPCDALIETGRAKIDYSFVTGESDPVNKNIGDLVYAGGRQIGSTLTMIVEKEVSQSYLTRLWNQDVFQKDKSGQNKNLVSKVSRYFTIAVIFIAIIASTVWYFIEPSEVVDVFTAVLIVACPCALALTLPFTYGNVIRIFGKRGIYLRDSDTVESMKDIDTIVFDKTGTITINKDFDIVFEGEQLQQYEIDILKSLTKHSAHPLSQAIFNHISGGIKEVTDFKEIPGQGISAIIDENELKLGAADFVNTKPVNGSNLASTVYVSINGIYRGYFLIRKKYRESLKETMAALREKYDVFILSGDNDSERETLAAIFGADKLYFNQTPEQKLQFIKQIQAAGKKVVMIGDGLNDAGALKQSDLGIAISDDVNTFSPACDIILAAENFEKLNNIFSFSMSVQKVVLMSFVFSFTYNLIGIIVAVSGLLTPLFAAILMPLSSITVVLFVTLAVNYISRKYF